MAETKRIKAPKDLSVETARATLTSLAADGLDIDVKSAISLIAERRIGDDRDPVSVTTQAMQGLRRKNGAVVNFHGMQAVQHQRWPPALKAVQTIAEAALLKRIRTQGPKGVAMNEVLATVNESTSAPRTLSVASSRLSGSPRRGAGKRPRSHSDSSHGPPRRCRTGLGDREPSLGSGAGSSQVPRMSTPRSQTTSRGINRGGNHSQSESINLGLDPNGRKENTDPLPDGRSFADLSPDAFMQYALTVRPDDCVTALRILQRQLPTAEDRAKYFFSRRSPHGYFLVQLMTLEQYLGYYYCYFNFIIDKFRAFGM